MAKCKKSPDLVGGFKHFLFFQFSIQLGMSSGPN
jgi:hypothetical protein